MQLIILFSEITGRVTIDGVQLTMINFQTLRYKKLSKKKKKAATFSKFSKIHEKYF